MATQSGELPVLDNPIFLRFARERLRLRQLLPWALVTVVFALFIFLLTYLGLLHRAQATTPQEAARSGFVALVIFQAFILMLLGTGRVAATVATDKERGLLDYHRITPMSPVSRIVGYLFGAPVMEYVLFLLTMPLSLYAILVGQMDVLAVGQLYIVGLSGVWLYHGSAMVAGMVASSPRRAAMLSQGLVLLLYLLVPQLGGLGFRFLQYLTARPTFLVVAERELGLDAGATMGESLADLGVVYFLNFQIGSTLFSLLLQGFLTFSLLLIVYRRWQRAHCHAFSKRYALTFYAVTMALIIGCLWPYLSNTALFNMVGQTAMQKITYGYMLLGALLALVLGHLISPTRHDYLRGLRRARKLGLGDIPRHSDEADATIWVISFMAIATMGFTLLMFAGRAFDRFDMVAGPPSWPTLALVLAVMLSTIAAGYFARAWGETRGMLMFAFLGWVCPLLAGTIVIVSAPDGEVAAAYVAAPSAPVGMGWSVLLLADAEFMTDPFARIAPHAFVLTVLSLAFHVMVAVIFASRLVELRRSLIASEAAAARTGDTDALPTGGNDADAAMAGTAAGP